MIQQHLFPDERSLFEKLCSLDNLAAGFKAVKRNGGSPGIDGVTIEQFGFCLDEELSRLKMEIEGWTYKPKPVRRVEIAKPGKGAGVRLLGIPSVRDRVVQATLKLLLEPILEPTFSDNSYGFRPGRDQTERVNENETRFSFYLARIFWLLGLLIQTASGKLGGCGGFDLNRLGFSAKAFWSTSCRYSPNLSGQAILNLFRCDQADSGMAMFGVVPGKEILAKSSGVLNGPEPLREGRAIF